jgi:GNAT superfamily N-acetyltransferase
VFSPFIREVPSQITALIIFLESIRVGDNDGSFLNESVTNDQIQIVPATEEHLPALAELAGVIWRQHYPGIISSAQIEYMLAKMYALATLREELCSKGIRFERLLIAGRFIGFASYGPSSEPGVMKLHKCYLLPELHGCGYGSRMLQHCGRAARALGARRLILAVNKQNHKAITAYRRNGFTVVESIITDFGDGFVMDDFIMAKNLMP